MALILSNKISLYIVINNQRFFYVHNPTALVSVYRFTLFSPFKFEVQKTSTL